ncbi:tau 95 subunit of transcription factor TFIIIC [Coemansia sp. RSA 1813]|nr:tau 95 subunit of transcription factor TFIIIC [Coemansia sp. RSA 1646]KAJ1769915.1 tau 95 subunit of transcription factor TFIIIC [Coemansia sp. RSA 1843]KAJ2087253.1 tau 95 subunit of transcription factor TFIIIC [Coemansia sp. RSA 986]KAJ2212086.1 tau 95 subunit of transcription factor TFIIIC [Coemansia sp. RSA 487]KAJ2570948.1 tau 95 subunit of transcription factor TFIIIC [Coemansia sp. RSA 1813]
MTDAQIDDATSGEEAAERRVLPQRTLVSVEYPGYVNNIETAIKTLGGRERLARTVTEDVGMPVELRYRNKDPASHPINGNVVPTQNLLIKVKRRTRVPRRNNGHSTDGTAAAPAETTAEVVGIIDKTVRFRTLADFQFISPPSDPLWKISEMLQSLDIEKIKEAGEEMLFESRIGTRDAYIPAPFLDRQGWPSQVPLSSHASDRHNTADESNTRTKLKRSAVEDRNTRPFHGTVIRFSSPTIPTEPNPMAQCELKEIPQALLEKVKGILEEQPVVSRNAMSILVPTAELNGLRLNIVMSTVSYLMENGPWRSCWIRFGYDPRKHEDAYKYQVLDMRSMYLKERGGRKRGNKRGPLKTQQESKPPRNPVEAQNYIFDMDAARQGISGMFQLMHVNIPVLKEMIEYPGGLRRRPCEKSGWLHVSLVHSIRVKARVLKKSLDGSAEATRELPIDYAELDRMLSADRRDEDAAIAAENEAHEREASARNGKLSRTMRSLVDAHVDQLMSQLATQSNNFAEAGGEVAAAAATVDEYGDFDDYDIFGEEELTDEDD